MTEKTRDTVSIPYVMSSRPNPFRIMWTGDWALSFHAWATLVDIDDAGNATPRLASKWYLSPDGLNWRFELLPNLRWSDGSMMLDSDIEASLRISLKGTSHTNLSESIESIKVKDHMVIFQLSRRLPAFLANLAYIDWAIVHPKTIKFELNEVEIKSLAPCSGAYCLTSGGLQNGIISEQDLELNPFSIYPNKLKLPKGRIVHHDSCEKLLDISDSLLAFRSYAEGFTDGCMKKLKEKGFELSKSHPTWILKADFTSKGMKDFSVSDRVWLLAKASESIKKSPLDFGVSRATGLRAPFLYGSLPVSDYEAKLQGIVPPALLAKNALAGRKIKIATMEQWSSWRSFIWLKEFLQKLDIKLEVKILSKEVFAAKRKEKILDKEYDLLFLPLGTGDPDPDSTWRIASRNLYSDTLDLDSIKKAFLETNREKRAQLYKELSFKLVEQGRMIPIAMDADIIGIHKSVQFEGVPLYRCGMTLYELAPKNIR